MPPAALSPFAGALLGLLHEQPRSGYDLRKLFASSPLAHYSDSPGSVYPALRRLAAAGLVRAARASGRTRRPREVFHPTPRGTAALRRWLAEDVTPHAVRHRMDDVLIRLAFLPEVLGREAAGACLSRIDRELALYLEELQAYAAATKDEMPLGGRLGLASGIAVVRARLDWCRSARRVLAAAGSRP